MDAKDTEDWVMPPPAEPGPEMPPPERPERRLSGRAMFGAALASVNLARPKPVDSAVLDNPWQCTKTAGFITVCTKTPG